MKNKILAISFLAVACTITVSAQVTEGEKVLRTMPADTAKGWKKGGVMGITLAQTSLTNWSAGGQNSVSVNGVMSLFANYQKGNSVWDNSLDMGYGIIKQGSNDVKKTDDKFEFLSKYGHKAFGNVYYSAMFSFRTQMAVGKDAAGKEISNLLAPGYILAALGLDYKPNSYFSAFLSPLTSKTTVVRDTMLSNAGAFGVEKGKKSLEELGGYARFIFSKGDFKSEFMKNISFTTKLDLFSNYLKNPQNIVVNWETLILMKVNKYLSMNLNTNLIYDDKVRFPANNGTPGATVPKVQFKEIFGAGLSFKF
ncbi:MAG TPA: DUF3078 domain-containing protein [Bacteroidales bacterium]|nr:DUF3078 domain-containing protein [Bacteroidales bacterium]